jgi:signal transduction histidine kinase/CheY-like chemotaxis protein/HAMP domain-containing protein
MQRMSIARSLRLALTGLTVALALIAALGLSGLYSARQRYDDAIVRTSALATASANLASAGIVEEEVLRDVRGPGTAAARRAAASAYRTAAAHALALARGDALSAGLVRAQIAQQSRARALAAAGRIVAATAVRGPLARARALATELERRQTVRQAAARGRTRSDSRRAIVLVTVAGLLALIGALALITGLVNSMRRPLDALVLATRELAAGDLSRRVEPAGPQELRDLGAAFNAMGDELSRATARLEEEHQRLAVTIASLGDALLVTAPASAVVVAANPRATQLVPEVPVGAATDGPGSPLPPLGDVLDGELTIEHDGRSLAVTAAPLGSQDAGVVWTVRDVSERARLEQAKSDFVATASHELRSPLTSIKGFVELLAHSPEGMSERQREFVDIILRSTDRLVELVSDLLDVARIEADRIELDHRPIDVGEAIRDVCELMGPRIEGKRQTLECRIPPALPLAVGDGGRVRQIVANLLTNAHLYTPEGGHLTVSAEGQRAWVEIVVSDSGVGMSAEQCGRVFERFYRADDGRSAPGTGLGMSIVKALVDMHDGRIEVESEPGVGSTFTVFLPAATPSLRPGSREVLRGRRVLVVDDEPDIARLIADQLEPFEVACTIATGGAEALELLRTSDFDAVTLDILMPRVDGFEVLRQIRGEPALRTIPVVFVSVFSGRRELAGEWVVSKPINAEELLDVLGAAVSSGRSRVLVVGRERMRSALEPSLLGLGIAHRWEPSGTAAARACSEARFEVALVDAGLRNPQAVLQALDLRGRRVRRAVIVFTDGLTPPPPGIERLGMEVVPVADVADALLVALDRER